MSSSPYIVEIKNLDDLPTCIICHQNIQDNAALDISSNTYCDCRFYFHQPCYEKWINLTRNQSCIICKTDISMNFIYTTPFNLDNSNNMIRNRRNFNSLDINNMSPRTRHRYGIPFSYTHRPHNFIDDCFNYLCCRPRPFTRNNPYVDDIIENLEGMVVVLLVSFVSAAIVIAIIVFTL